MGFEPIYADLQSTVMPLYYLAYLLNLKFTSLIMIMEWRWRWRQWDSNPRRLSPTGLQPAFFAAWIHLHLPSTFIREDSLKIIRYKVLIFSCNNGPERIRTFSHFHYERSILPLNYRPIVTSQLCIVYLSLF